MAQEYDMYEYWRQFDENSRWVGFVGNVEKIKENEELKDDTISMMDYILARTSNDYYVSDDEVIQPPVQQNATISNECLPTKKFSEIQIDSNENCIQVKKDETVIQNLDNVFYHMKETVK